MPNKLIGQRFQINDRVSRKNYSVIANTYQKKYGNITEAIEKENSAGTEMYYYKLLFTASAVMQSCKVDGGA